TTFTLDVNLTDGQAHRVALYAVDWDNRGRSERVDVVDAATGAVLDSRTLSAFSGGKYLVWTLSGHVQLRVTNLSGVNAGASRLFFGGPQTATAASSTMTRNAEHAIVGDGPLVLASEGGDPAGLPMTNSAHAATLPSAHGRAKSTT